MTAATPQLTELELVAGIPLGRDDTAPPLGPPAPDASPRAALEDAVLLALLRPPCCVMFSGGRDSSAVLAVAAHVARREGLAPPIPLTLDFGGAAGTDERGWQDLVVGHLGLTEWERIEFSGDYDLLGETMRAALLRHGPTWPPLAGAMPRVHAAARGGSVLTGADGDGLLDTWQWSREARVLTGRLRPRPRDALRLLKVAAPVAARRRFLMRRLPLESPWLDAATEREAARTWADTDAREPLWWHERVGWWARLRGTTLNLRTQELVAAECGSYIAHPLADDAFLRALAADGGRAGYADRTAAMRRLFADLLPDAVNARADKGDFGAPLWGPQTRRLLADWDGRGLPGCVDAEWLRRAWTSGEEPPARTLWLAQLAWRSAQGEVSSSARSSDASNAAQSRGR